MGLFSRARKFLLGNLYDLFDRFERPDRAARQCVRDLEQAIDAAATATARSIASERLLRRHSDQLRRKLEEREQRATDAAQAGDEALAKLALRQKFDTAESLAETETRLAEATAVNESLRAQLDVMRSEHRQAVDRAALQTARQITAAATCEVAASVVSGGGGPQIHSELERTFERVDRSILEIEARTELYCDESRETERRFAAARRDRYVAEEWNRLTSQPTPTA